MKDNFSSHASIYSQFRPVYPPELYDFLLSLVSETKLAWDCGCGNGQVAGALANCFEKIEATDISEKQIEFAVRKPNIHYCIAPAEKTNLADESVTLVTVAQAIHWFDFEAFYREVHRVSKRDSVIAVWGYSLLKINESIDPIIRDFYSNTLGQKYWDAERHFVDERYQTIPFPFDEIKAPDFSIHVKWSLEHLLGYLNSWSGVQHYIRKNGENPVEQIQAELRKIWGEANTLDIQFPLFSRVGRIQKRVC